MNKTCPKCGCGMTVEDDGRPMHVGRVFGVPDSYFCVARQRDQLVERNRELVEALSVMEMWVPTHCENQAVAAARAVLARAKEAKP